MKDSDCVEFLQWALPRLRMRWPGFRKVRRQVCKRIARRLQELELPDASAYVGYLEGHPQEWIDLDRLCRVTISRFYRDRGAFDFVREQVAPALARAAQERDDARLRCWSAGCASGEEPYTLALIWNLSTSSRFPDATFSVLATDADAHLLERARAGAYAATSLKDLPQAWLEPGFDRTDDLFRIRPAHRACVEFRHEDLRTGLPDGPFDLVVCRNLVFTYFETSLQDELLRGFADRIVAGGALIVGIHEKLRPGPASAGLRDWAAPLGVYRRRES